MAAVCVMRAVRRGDKAPVFAATSSTTRPFTPPAMLDGEAAAASAARDTWRLCKPVKGPTPRAVVGLAARLAPGFPMTADGFHVLLRECPPTTSNACSSPPWHSAVGGGGNKSMSTTRWRDRARSTNRLCSRERPPLPTLPAAGRGVDDDEGTGTDAVAAGVTLE